MRMFSSAFVSVEHPPAGGVLFIVAAFVILGLGRCNRGTFTSHDQLCWQHLINAENRNVQKQKRRSWSWDLAVGEACGAFIKGTVSPVFSCRRCFTTEDGALTKVIVSRVFSRSRCFTMEDGALTKIIVSRVRSDAQFVGDVCFHWLTTHSALNTVLQAACWLCSFADISLRKHKTDMKVSMKKERGREQKGADF